MAVSFNCPWVLRACRRKERRLPLPQPLRQAAKPPFHGWEGITRIRNDSARCRRTKTHGENRVIGLRAASCSTGYYPRSNAFPPRCYGFFLFFSFRTTIRRRVFVELGAFLPLFDFCFNLRSFYVVFFFLFGFRHSRMSIDWLSFSCVIFLFFFLLCIFDITLMHASDMRVKKEHYIDLWFDICIFDSIAGIDGMV